MLSFTFPRYHRPAETVSTRWLVVVGLTLHNHGLFCSLTQNRPLRSYMRLIRFHGLTRTTQRFGNSSGKGGGQAFGFWRN